MCVVVVVVLGEMFVPACVKLWWDLWGRVFWAGRGMGGISYHALLEDCREIYSK